MIINPFNPAWYVLHTRSRFENVVYDGLIGKSIETFLPKHQVRSKRRDRKVVLRVPLFPGYVFFKSDMNPNEHLEVLKTIGVVRIISNKDGPLSVPDETIESLKIMIHAADTITTGTRFKKGDPVIVVSGPFVGVTGIFQRYKGKGRVIINLDALGQYASVDVSEDDVEILPKIGS